MSDLPNIFGRNLKLLRKRKKRSQEDVAMTLDIKRSSLSGYENGSAYPPLHVLIQFSNYYRVSLDHLLKTDLSSLSESKFRELEASGQVDVTGKRLRVLATTVNADNEENVEMVTAKAKAGYAAGYADPEFVAGLPVFHLPFLSKSKKYRAFEISGDSMPPVNSGDWVIAEYVDNWKELKNGVPYVILTDHDGIVFKLVYERMAQANGLLLCSSNPFYEPYLVNMDHILEIWKFVHYISPEFRG